MGGAWWAAGRLWAPALAAVVAVAVDAVLTGGLHLDGLADSADGLIPPVPRTRRFEIMADPRVGVFGAVALVLVLGLRITALASTPAKVLVVAALWCGSRTIMAVVALTVPSAHAEVACPPPSRVAGPDAAAPRRTASPRTAWPSPRALAALGAGSRGLAVVAAEVVAALAVVWFAGRRLGGYTGDVLGACGVIGETVGLLVLVAR